NSSARVRRACILLTRRSRPSTHSRSSQRINGRGLCQFLTPECKAVFFIAFSCPQAEFHRLFSTFITPMDQTGMPMRLIVFTAPILNQNALPTIRAVTEVDDASVVVIS